MIFAWDDRNRDHIAEHRVTPDEAEEVVRGAEPPYPELIEDDKLLVWGHTAAGRYLQVIFSVKKPDEVEYESLPVEDWLAIQVDGIDEVIRVIHAMDLTSTMKRRLRRRRK